MRLKGTSEVRSAHIDLTPMIDTVMFLLIFFMVVTRLGAPETDLGIILPGGVEQAGPVEMPDEQVIQVDVKGNVVLNDTMYEGKNLPELVKTLVLYRLAADQTHTKALITVMAEDGANYERVIDVLNACAGAGIKNVTFGTGGG